MSRLWCPLLALLFFAAAGHGGALPAAGHGGADPVSPCPDIFAYKLPEAGVLTLGNDLSGRYELEVNMTSDADTDIVLKHATPPLRISGGDNLTYHVNFSKEYRPPHLLSVVYQGKLLCNNSEARGAYRLTKRDVSTRKVRQLKPSFNYNFPQKPKQQSVSEICGTRVDTAPFIVNGLPTYVGEFPWLVAMFSFDNGKYGFTCGGNLVSRTHVITAAHCFKDQANRDIDWRSVVFALGRHNIETWLEEAVVRGVEKYTMHPDYKRPSDGDLGVIKLDAPVDISTTIRPICLWDEEESIRFIEGEFGDVAGWGRDETGKAYVDEPKKVRIPIVAQDTCLRSDARYFKLVSDRTFCAGLKNGTAPCTGDSGSAFMIQRDGKWRLRGLVSAGLVIPGNRTCDPNHYTVFSDMAKYKPWILQQLDGSI